MKEEKRIYNVITIIVMILMFVFMCSYASKQSFWLDELDWMIEFIATQKFSRMIYSLLLSGFNLPLSYVILFPVYKLVPYGELWLLLPCIFAILFGVYMVKKIGDKIGGNKFGMLCLFMASTSYIVIYQGAYELRPYPFLFCFSALTLYRYLCLLEDRNKKNIVLYTISLILLAYTHWFGCLLISFYFLVELYLCIRKKSKISFLVPYVVLGVAFLPWFISMMIIHTSNFTQYWGGIPTIRSTLGIITYLLSKNIICEFMFIISMILFIIYLFTKHINKINLLSLCVGSIAWVVGTTLIYSKFINRSGSLFVDRYFFELLPHIFVITAFALLEFLNSKFIKNIKIKSLNINVKPIIIFLIFIVIGYQNYYKVIKKCTSIREPYREVSEILHSDKSIYEEDSAVITGISRAFLTYYFEKHGYSLPKNVLESTNSGLIQFVKNTERTPDNHLSTEDLLQYNKLYIINIFRKIENDADDFISQYYDLKESYSDINLFVYEKRKTL